MQVGDIIFNEYCGLLFGWSACDAWVTSGK
jgi:hypothetical protein